MGIKIARIICKFYANLSGNLWLHYRSNPLKPFHRNIPLNPVIYIMFMLAGTWLKTRVRDRQSVQKPPPFHWSLMTVTVPSGYSFTCFSCSFIDSYIIPTWTRNLLSLEPGATTGSPIQDVGSRTKHKITGGSFKHHIVTCSYCVGNSG